MNRIPFVVMAATALTLVSARAAVTYTETGTDSPTNPARPTYQSSTTFDANIQKNDLIEGLTPTSNVSSGDAGTHLSGINDGLATDDGSGDNVTWFNNGFGAGQISSTLPSNPVLTYTLPTTPFNLGYTITSINSIFGFSGPYSGPAEADQNYSISYSTVAAPGTFVSLATVAYDPYTDIGPNGSSSSQVLTNIVGLTGVAAVRFSFTTNNTSEGEIVREIDVDGVAAPEPSTYALLLAGGAGLVLLACRRRIVA